MALIDHKDVEESKNIIAIKMVYLFLCVILGVIGNSVVIIAILRNKKLQTVTNYFVFNLAIADLLFTVCGVPTIISTTIAQKWLLGSIVCDAVGFLNSLFCTTSIWTLVMISINRYFNVAKANEIKNLYTRKKTVKIIICVWIFSAIASFPPLIGWSEFRAGANFCTINGKKSLSYSIVLGLVAYVIPLVFLTVLYFRIFFMLHKHEKRRLKMATKAQFQITKRTVVESSSFDDMSVSSNSFLSITEKFNNEKSKEFLSNCNTVASSELKYDKIITESVSLESLTNSPATKKLHKIAVKKYFKQVRITKMLMFLVISFFICWTPFIVGSILYSFEFETKRFHATTFGIMCACLNSILNPLIYAILNRNFRQYVVKIRNIPFCCYLCRKYQQE